MHLSSIFVLHFLLMCTSFFAFLHSISCSFPWLSYFFCFVVISWESWLQRMHWHHLPCPPTSRTEWTCFLTSACTRPRKQPSFLSLTCRLGDDTWIVPEDLCLGKRNLFLPALWVVLPRRTLSPLRSPTSLSFLLLRPRHQRERAEQRIPPLMMCKWWRVFQHDHRWYCTQAQGRSQIWRGPKEKAVSLLQLLISGLSPPRGIICDLTVRTGMSNLFKITMSLDLANSITCD